MAGFVRARIDDELKEDAAAVLATLGLSVSDVIRMLLTRIAKEKALPIELVTPNAKTIAAMEEARRLVEARKARFGSLEELFDDLEAKAAEARQDETPACG